MTTKLKQRVKEIASTIVDAAEANGFVVFGFVLLACAALFVIAALIGKND